MIYCIIIGRFIPIALRAVYIIRTTINDETRYNNIPIIITSYRYRQCGIVCLYREHTLYYSIIVMSPWIECDDFNCAAKRVSSQHCIRALRKS